MESSNVTQEALAAVQAVQLELTGENATTLALRRPFDPVAHDLDASFRLTKYADLKGWGCKVPQDCLAGLLLAAGLQEDANNTQDHEQSHFLHFPYTRIGILKIPTCQVNCCQLVHWSPQCVFQAKPTLEYLSCNNNIYFFSSRDRYGFICHPSSPWRPFPCPDNWFFLPPSWWSLHAR